MRDGVCLMGRRFHRGFTAAEKTELWDRWKRGESLKAIGRAFGKPSSSIYFLVAPHGGIRPAQRRRSGTVCTRAAPCANFADAANAAITWGEVNCLDSGVIGSGTITKSITIDCAGVVATTSFLLVK